MRNPTRNSTKVPGAQAIGRAFDVLRQIAAAPQGASAADVARTVNLPRTTVIRMFRALEAEGLIRLDAASGAYQVGPGVLQLASQYLTQHDVRRAALPSLWALARATGETVNLAIQDDLHSISIEQIESPQAVRVVNWIGRPLWLHATATGKAWLAFQPAHVVDDVLMRLAGADGRLPACAERTITDGGVLRAELAGIRARGYAETHEELEPWLTAVAAPIFDHDGVVAATLVVSGLSLRLGASKVEEVGRLTVAEARQVSAILGHRPASDHVQRSIGRGP
jgi:DNA-binding IclR family transcriptional regulator